MTLRLLPFDPSDALLTAAATLLQEGIVNWAPSPPPQPSWPLTQACPADHFLAPEGTKMFLSTQPGKVEKTPFAILLRCPEELREKSERINGAWAVHLWADVRRQKDASDDEAAALIKRIQLLLTHPLKLADDSIQQPQARLNTEDLHVFGAHYRDNFEETAHGAIGEDDDGYPTWRFGTRITCALYGTPS